MVMCIYSALILHEVSDMVIHLQAIPSVYSTHQMPLAYL